MRRSNTLADEKSQMPYSRRRNDPQFYAMKRNLSARQPTLNLSEDSDSSISKSLSDIWELESERSPFFIPKNNAMKLDIAELELELKIPHASSSTSYPKFDLSIGEAKLDKMEPFDSNETLHIEKERKYHEDEKKRLYHEDEKKKRMYYEDGKKNDSSSISLPQPVKDEKKNDSSSISLPQPVRDEKKNDSSRFSLPQPATLYYLGNSIRNDASSLELCEGVDRLNQYLKARNADLTAGVPGRFLHAVLGQEFPDVASLVSTILYAFFLNETLNSDQICVLPIINMKRAHYSMHSELKWLLHSCRVDESYLVFIDEIDLSYYDLFGSLKLVLVNSQKLPSKQEGLKEVLVEIFNCNQIDTPYPSVEKVTIAEDCSCCTVLAEKFVETLPEILAGQGFSRLLLSGIILDTANLTGDKCTDKDKHMVTLLLRGAGRFGCNGLYQLLEDKMFDISELNVKDILRKEFKKWTRVSGKPNSAGRLTVTHIGMSSIGISVEQLLSHEDSAAQEVGLFQKLEKLQLLMIVAGYHDKQRNFKREILVSTNTAELMRNFLHFFDINGAHLPCKALDRPDLNDELRAFEIDNELTSTSIERLLEEFGGVLKKQ